MKIAITGGAGFIGSHVTKAYLDAGHDVLVIDTLVNGSYAAIDTRARFYPIDIRSGEFLKILQRERPDIVSHHAAQREQRALPLEEQSLADADVHVRGLLNVLECCVGASVGKIIFASGGNSLYGRVDLSGQSASTVGEDAPLCPRRPYDISKVAGEWYVRYYTRRYGLAHTIFRYADVYGETDDDLAQHPVSYFTRMLLEGRHPIIRGAADETRDHIFIDDVVRANVCALERGHNQTVHISSGEGYDQNQIYRAVADLLSSQVDPVYISNALVEASSIVLDNTLARKVLGWYPEIHFTAGVQCAVERMREHMWRESPVETTSDVQFSEPSLVGTR